MPTFTPSPGAYYRTPLTVSISTPTLSAAIYYTTDGSTPTSASFRYTAPLTISSTATVRAMSVNQQSVASAVATAKYVINSPLAVSAGSFSFGRNIVQNAISQTVATVTNVSSAAVSLAITTTGDQSYSLNSAQSCGTQLAAGAECNLVVQYLPTTTGTQSGVVQVSYSGTTTGSSSVTLTGTSVSPPSGTVATTTNPLVARYTVTPGFPATVVVEFGSDLTYGFTTSAVTTATSAAPVSLLVAGMRANTTYHMRASITYADGNVVANADQTFDTGSLPVNIGALTNTATTAPGQTPQPGIELLDPAQGAYQPYAVDLQGNIIWFYPWADATAPLIINPLKLMSNGDFIGVIGVLSSDPLTTTAEPSTIMIREFDLEGITVKQLTLADLNTKLAAANYNVVLANFHHDIVVLPNGHWLILANTLKSVNGANVLGDVVVDVDTDLNPKFVWNEFDYLDVNRQPMGFPDWTHTNALLYSPDDGNFIVSIRHQNWVVKVNYQNGAGDGSIIWKLGYQGDFALVNGADPMDWQYAQHGPSFVGSATAGTFNLVLFDNGNDRVTSGTTGLCGVDGNLACYSTVPLFQVDETANTATIQEHLILPPSLYSDFGGNAEVLANNDLEFDICAATGGSQIDEVLQDVNFTPVWSLVTNGVSEYRGFRLPSLYTGVQWPSALDLQPTETRLNSRQSNSTRPLSR